MTERSEARFSNRIRRAPISLVTAGPDARTVRAQTRTHRMTDYLNSPSRVQVLDPLRFLRFLETTSRGSRSFPHHLQHLARNSHISSDGPALPILVTAVHFYRIPRAWLCLVRNHFSQLAPCAQGDPRGFGGVIGAVIWSSYKEDERRQILHPETAIIRRRSRKYQALREEPKNGLRGQDCHSRGR
jgi:hypothetical protein